MTDGAVAEPVFDYDAVLSTIRSGTPEGWVWRVKFESEFGIKDVTLILRKGGAAGVFGPRYEKTASIGQGTTELSFRNGVLNMAVMILEERMVKATTPDWAKLAKELQEILNGK